MLNRRLLRIKAMQALYALKQSEISNHNAGYDFIRNFFAPDLNAMESPDHKQLELNRKKASKLYEDYFKSGRLSKGDEEADIIKSAESAVKEYVQQCAQDKKHFHRLMFQDIDHVYDEYLMTLQLLLELDLLMKEEEGRKSKINAGNNYSRFHNNIIIQALSTDKTFQQLLQKKNLKWPEDIVKTFYKEAIRTDDVFMRYLSKDKADPEADVQAVQHLIKDVIVKNNNINAYYEEIDLNWVENKSIVKSMVAKTVKNVQENPGEFKLLEISANWDEDKEYFADLYEKCLANEKELEQIVVNKVKNWDIERVALVDRIILKLALTEMLYCPNIPVKVSINEYIELSKNYSTPKSKQFVNGLLDVLAEDLSKNGKIKKSGKGLIDNK